MPTGGQDAAQLDSKLESKLQLVLGFQRPTVLAFHASAVIAAVDNAQQGAFSPVWLLTICFGLLGAAFPYLQQSQGAAGKIVPYFGHLEAAVVLGYHLVTLHLMGYRTVVQDATCCRLGGLYLALVCARNHYDAALHLSVHFTLLACSSLGSSTVDMLFLLITDMFCLFVAWLKGGLIETLRQVLEQKKAADAADADGKNPKKDMDTLSTVSTRSVQSTLHGTCNTVVPLCPDLRLTEDCPELGAMLGLTNTKQCRAFTDFLCPDDVPAFLTHMRRTQKKINSCRGSANDSPLLIGSVRLRLVDASGSFVHVRLFQSAYGSSPCGPASVLLGISEVSSDDEEGGSSSKPPSPVLPKGLRRGDDLPPPPEEEEMMQPRAVAQPRGHHPRRAQPRQQADQLGPQPPRPPQPAAEQPARAEEGAPRRAGAPEQPPPEQQQAGAPQQEGQQRPPPPPPAAPAGPPQQKRRAERDGAEQAQEEEDAEAITDMKPQPSGEGAAYRPRCRPVDLFGGLQEKEDKEESCGGGGGEECCRPSCPKNDGQPCAGNCTGCGCGNDW